eukprot:4459113-Prymnesium_polylepis.2
MSHSELAPENSPIASHGPSMLIADRKNEDSSGDAPSSKGRRRWWQSPARRDAAARTRIMTRD